MTRLKLISANEKRKNKHLKVKAQMKYSNQDLEDFPRVEMINFSKGGMCFESGYKMGPGTRIFIKRQASLLKGARPVNTVGCLAEVKWCRPIPGKGAYFYHIGVQYVEPINHSQCHEWRPEDKLCILPATSLEADFPT